MGFLFGEENTKMKHEEFINLEASASNLYELSFMQAIEKKSLEIGPFFVCNHVYCFVFAMISVSAEYRYCRFHLPYPGFHHLFGEAFSIIKRFINTKTLS